MKHNLNPVMNAQLDRNRRFKTHRRNLSDPRFSTSLTDAYGEDEVNLDDLSVFYILSEHFCSFRCYEYQYFAFSIFYRWGNLVDPFLA